MSAHEMDRKLNVLFSKLLICFSILLSHFSEAATFRWAADTESGAPFSFKDPANPGHLIGFEVEIIEAIGRRIQRQPIFVQNSWDGLIQGLERKDYDVVINGLEITPDRKEVVRFSKPYYISSEKLTVQATNTTIHTLSDLAGRKVGTLDGSLAYRILKSDSPKSEIVPYDEEVHAYNDLENGRIDAVLLDEPIALYYAQSKKLKTLRDDIGRMEYGIAFRKSDEPLAQEVDQAIQDMIEDGELRKILERWGLWNSITAKSWLQDPVSKSEPEQLLRFSKSLKAERTFADRLKLYWSFLPILAKGAALTLLISLLSMVLAVLVGLLLAIGRHFGNGFIRGVATAYIEIWRGTPLLIQLYLIFYGLPNLGVRLDPLLAGVLGLGLNYGASEAENYRAGLNSVPEAQASAGAALGMSRWQIYRYVQFPQAVRFVIPPMTNDFIALLKDSSLVSVITMIELTTIYGQLASTYFDYLGIGLVVALVYFLLGLPFVRLARWAETQLNKTYRNPQKG